MTQLLQQRPFQDELSLCIDDYPGGIAIWGALPALIDTSSELFDRGVHVHARHKVDNRKVIDNTYKVVHCYYQDQYFSITESTAVSFTMSSIFNIKLVALSCVQCQSDIIPNELSAVIPGHAHTCQHCNKINYTTDYCIVNPLIKLKSLLGDHAVQRKTVIPKRSINLDVCLFKGGFQIWGSNPAILWTSPKKEESALHVHAFKEGRKRIIDNTYGEVMLDGQLLDIQAIRVLQIQHNLIQVLNKLDRVRCPRCNEAIFDTALRAVIPTTEKQCNSCHYAFKTHQCISNPYYDLVEKYNEQDL